VREALRLDLLQQGRQFSGVLIGPGRVSARAFGIDTRPDRAAVMQMRSWRVSVYAKRFGKAPPAPIPRVAVAR